jgi:predicted metal-dependent HD superfamily phosphohydrolase
MSLYDYWPAVVGDHSDLRDRLVSAYGDPARGYHDLRHLTEVLEHVSSLGAFRVVSSTGGDVDRDAVLLAAWFHDAVHDGSPDDEERSAALAERELGDAGLPSELVEEVGRLVRLTVAHRPADDDANGQLLCDADLAILAADEDRYREYVGGVRREYAHVDEAAFRAGRAAVLRDLVAKPTLFHTGAARQRWEARARSNLARELSQLEG